MKSKLTTLCYLEKNDSYLLLHRIKKQNDINKDKWIGVGGHFEDFESPDECLVREVFEETGLKLNSYQFRGIVTFVSHDSGEKMYEYMCLYTSSDFSGTMIDCDEGKLEWVKKADMKKLNFWEGDYIFLDLIERRVPFFSLKLNYDEKGNLIDSRIS